MYKYSVSLNDLITKLESLKNTHGDVEIIIKDAWNVTNRTLGEILYSEDSNKVILYRRFL
jgi:hypothetical protein